MRYGLITALLVMMAAHAAIAQVPLNQLPAAGQPLGIIPDAVMLSQGAGCSAHLQPCSAVQSPSLRIGQPMQTDVPPAAPFAYQPWIQTETNPPTLRQWLGTGWGTIGALDTSGAIWTPPIGGGMATTLSASSTTDLTSVPQSVVTLAGNATISDFGGGGAPSSVPANWNIPGTLHQLLFSGYAELEHSTSLTLPTAANITTGPGDTLLALNQGDGVWKVVSYQPALNYGITALRGDPSGAMDSAALFTRQDTAASNAGGRALVLAAGNYNLSSTVGGTEANAYLLMPGAYFTGAGSLAANADPTVTAMAGQTKFGLLGTMSAAGNSYAWSGNQDILFVSSVVPPTISPANYIKAGIYSRITTTDVSTYSFLDGAYLPAKERAAAGIVSSCEAAAINGECFGLRAVATASAAAAVQAGQFLVYNNSGIAQPYPLQPDSSYGITIASAGTQNATAAILLDGSLSRFQDGVVFNPDAVEDNLIVAYKNLGQDQMPGFRVRSSRNGGSFDLATLGKVSIGQTTGPLLDCCNLLAHYATGINLMLGVSNGAPGNYAIAAANDYGMVIPIEVKSPLVADQWMVVGGTSYLNGSVDVTGWLTAWGGATISGKLYVAGVFSVTPATPDRNSPCTPGQQTSDHDYNYTCASSGHWKRVRLEDY